MALKIELKIEGASQQEMERYTEVLCALISTGSLTGVRSGKTIIHFDAMGEFAKIELDYFPFVKRSTKTDGTALNNGILPKEVSLS